MTTNREALPISISSISTPAAAAPVVLKNLTRVHNLAFPGYAQYCSGAGAVQLFINRENQPIAGITSNKLKLKIDTGFGHSGSPLYYCPSGDDSICSGSEKAYVIGVMAGWNATTKRAVGPKAADFRSEAVVFLND